MNKRTYKIGELSTLLKRGITPSYTHEHLVKVVNQKCIRSFQVNLDLARYTDPVKKNISDEKYLKNFDVLVNSTGVGTLGRVAQIFEINQPTTADSHVTIIRPNQKIVDPLYFGYCMKSIQKKIELLGEGSTGQTELSRILLSDVEIDIIENIEQQRIVGEFLKVIDTKIELNQQMNETLGDMGKTIFKSWFIDFEPVRAKAEGRPTGLSDKISELFPDSFENSEFGKIPSGWKVRKVSENFETILGGTPARKNKEFWQGNLGWINSGKLNDFPLNTASEYISEDAVQKSSTKLANRKSTLIGLVTEMGNGLITFLDEEFYVNQSVVSIQPNSNIFPEYVYLYLKANSRRLYSEQSGGAQQHINKGIVNNFKILLPDTNCLSKISYYFESIFSKICTNSRENLILENLRDTLLSKLISGELKIPDAKNFIEETSI